MIKLVRTSNKVTVTYIVPTNVINEFKEYLTRRGMKCKVVRKNILPPIGVFFDVVDVIVPCRTVGLLAEVDTWVSDNWNNC